MVNQFRTCLLNFAAAAIPDPGEEYVPAGYRAVDLTPDLEAARSALLGPGADRSGASMTAARITAYLAASRFAASLTSGDPRLTYDPLAPVDLWDSIGASAVTVSGDAPVGWYGAAEFRKSGRGYAAWAVTADGAGGYTVVPGGGSPAAGSVTSSDLGDTIPLPGSRLSLVVPTGGSGRWSVSLLVPPAHQWASAAGRSVEGVFAPSSGDEEAGWFAAWSDPYAPAPLRAGALALALSARAYELFSASGGTA